VAGTIEAYETAKGKRYRVRYRKPDGAQTDKRGFKTKREAELFLASTTVSKASGEYLDPTQSRRTVATFADQWKRGRLAALKPSSQNTMETSWRIHVEPRWGSRRVASVRSSEVEDWISELVREGKSAQTIRRAVIVLSTILSIAERDRIIIKNPARGVQLPAKTKKPHRYLTHEQVALLVSSSEEPEITLALAYTGLRWGEMAALKVQHLDLLRRRISVEDNSVVVRGEYVTGTPKSGHRREVPIAPFLVTHLARLCEGKSRASYVFGGGDFQARYPHAASGWFVRAVRVAQEKDPSFPTLTPHALRHTAASLAIAAGANVKAVQRMLGHASAAMTLDVYADLFDDDLDSVAVAMSVAREAAVS
jgi:integrase